MGFDSWNSVFSRNEPKAIDRFKNKSRLLKEFGPNGVRIYNSIDSIATAERIMESLSIPPDEFSRIFDFMLENQLIVQSDAPPREHISFSEEPSSEDYSAKAPRSLTHLGASEAHPELSEAHNMSPMEKTIFDSYGEQGLKIYSLIDGHKSARQILEQTGVSETKLVEILEFMNKRGIIKLDKPATSQATASNSQSSGGFSESASRPEYSQSSPGSYRPRSPSPRASNSPEPGFSPMVETMPTPPSSMQVAQSPDCVPVDVPSFPPNFSIVSKVKVNALMALKFGKTGSKLIPLINGIRDYVQLSIESELSMHDLDIILGELGKHGLLTFRQLDRTEIQHKYGDDGLAVFKKFGRDGIMIYQLIGKANSLTDIIKKSHIEQERAIDIIMFVHSMLGLDMPLDRDMIYRYITKGKK